MAKRHFAVSGQVSPHPYSNQKGAVALSNMARILAVLSLLACDPVTAADSQPWHGMVSRAKVGDPERAPDSNRPPLAETFGDKVPDEIRQKIDNAAISVDGFPVIRTLATVVMCVSESDLQEALRIFDIAGHRYPRGCIDVPPGTEVEWFRFAPTPSGITRLRANGPHGYVDIHATSQWQNGPANAWFELIPRAH